MFNGGQSGVLFSGPAAQTNTFGQAANNVTGFFGSNTQSSGTTCQYQPVDSTDSIQKNNQNVNISTKLHCLTAMKVYETKSIEELRSEDYQSNRLTKSTNAVFGGQQGANMMNNQQTIFSSYTPNQQNQNVLFGSTNQQTSNFGNKPLFGSTNTSANATFGGFNNQAKPASLFSTTSSISKPLFSSVQSSQPSSIFGSPTVSSTSTIFGAQPQPVQTSSFFGTSQPSQAQSSNLFGNSNTGSFGFQSQANQSLFGSNNKGFGTTGGFTATSTTPSVFGSTTSTSGSLFGQQNQQSTAFGVAAKAPLFTNTFSTQPASSQGTSLFGQNTSTPLAAPGVFGSTQKPATQFGTNSAFNSNASKPSLFGNASVNTPFPSQPSAGFGTFGSNTLPFNTQTISTSTIVPSIGYSSPAEALFQQQLSQQKILSLVSNRPYGVNKLFLGQSLNSERIITSSETVTNNTNLTSLAIKRNDTESCSIVPRRKILDQKTKIIPNTLHKVFSGFDEDDDTSVKFNNIDKHFFTKREDWKYLPPNAFDKSRVSITDHSINANNDKFISRGNSAINNNTSINSNNEFITESGLAGLFTSPISYVDRRAHLDKATYYSTPKTAHRHNFSGFNPDFSPICSGVGETKSESLSRDIVDDNHLGVSSFEQINSTANVCLDDDSSIQSHQKEEKEVVEEDKRNCCKIKLTKNGYYTAPQKNVLDKLVMKNVDGEFECWVENFIIGRNTFGSIRFPGLTNVYGLDFDELVDIRRMEVSVYPDDDRKPEEGDELNKRAQIVLFEVWPTDKSTNQKITDEDRLRAMNFENKLQRNCGKMGAKFLSYSAPKGVWTFEVEHFSKYRYDDDEDEEEENDKTKNVVLQENQLLNNNTNNRGNNVTVSAEADSMTDNHYDEELPIMKNDRQRMFNHSSNKSIQRMKQSLYQNDDDEEEDDVHRNRFFPPNRSLGGHLFYKEEPQAKRFETAEMGRSMLNTSTVDSPNQFLVVRDTGMGDNDYENTRRIKPIVQEPIASTKRIVSSNRDAQSLKIPNQFRDIRTMKMPYLPMKLKRYFDIEPSENHKKCQFDAAMSQGNRFRVGLHLSSNSNSPGLKFLRKDNTNHTDTSVSLRGIIRQESVPSNNITIMTLGHHFSEYQEQLLQSALRTSACSFIDGNDCPLWRPAADLRVLNDYVDVPNQCEESHDFEAVIFGRIVSLCKALWANIGNEDTTQSTPYLKHLERKQALSKWIRTESRKELMKKVECLLRGSSMDVNKCNDVILESLCCGEISLACQLATKTNQHRMALLISQCSGSLRSRAMVREQLNGWIGDKTDQNIPANILCIYVLLSGLTSATVSDGSCITPLKRLKWYQTFGCYQWFIQPYLDSIKSSLDLYEEDFKTDLDIPAPFPISSPDVSTDTHTEDDYYPYHDCCFHLLKLSCDSLHDLDATLNPPAISRHNDHRLSLDWSSSWHLANILTSLGHSVPSGDKLCQEWAAQLERAGQWQWAVFTLLHMADPAMRRRAAKDVIVRHGSGSDALTKQEQFLVERLRVPAAWVHEAKALRCKADGDYFGVASETATEAQALHWLRAGHWDRAHDLCVDAVLPRLLLNDRHERMRALLDRLVAAGLQRRVARWTSGAGLYRQYLAVAGRVRVLRTTNRLLKYAVLAEDTVEASEAEAAASQGEQTDGTIEDQLHGLEGQARRLLAALDGFRASDPEKIICRRQMDTVCKSFLRSCAADGAVTNGDSTGMGMRAAPRMH